jgi:hypothetical protein
MAFTIFLVFCTAALAFMLRFLIALQKETRQVMACRPVPVYWEFEGGGTSRSRAPVRNVEVVHHRHNPSAA